MNATATAVIMAGLALGSALPAWASGHSPNGCQAPAADTITREGYTLVFINRQPDFDTTTRQRMIDAFFTVYPKEANRFNTHTAKKVVFTIDPDYDGVAATGNDTVRYNPKWLKAHPEDIDVVTHEAMHIVQAYTHPVPGWLTEGIADYVRYVFGVNNQNGNWRLPDLRPGQNYTNAYRITARFLVWVEKNYPGTVDSLDKAAREGKYTSRTWTKLTSKTVDELWQAYTQNPQLELTYR
jgi:hypothetical protein